MAAVINCIKISIMHQLIIIIYIYSNNSAVYNRTRIYPQLFILVTVFGLKVTSITVPPGADFTKGLKPVLGLKFKTLVLNSVKNVLSQQA